MKQWLVDKTEIRSPQKYSQIGEKDAHPEGDDQLSQYRSPHHLTDDEAVDQEAQNKEESRADRNGEKRIQTVEGVEPEGGEHAEHQKIAVGEIDNIHDPPDEGQTNSNEGIDEPDQ